MKASASKGMWIILALFLAVKLIQFTKFHMLIWDEAVYVAMGKWLLSGGSIGLYEPIRPLIFPLILGIVWRLGLPVVAIGELLQILFALGVIWVTYLIGSRVFNKGVGILAALLLSVYPVFFLYSNYLLVGTTSTLFVLLALYFYLEHKYACSGVLAGLAFLTRFPQGLVLVVLLAALGVEFLKSRDSLFVKRGVTIFVAFVTTTLPFFVFNYFINRTKTTPLKAMLRPLILAQWHQNNPFEAVAGGKLYTWFYYFVKLFSQNWTFIFIASALVFIILYRLYRKQGVKLLLLYLGVFLVYYSYIINKQDRFIISFLPAVCILIAYGIKALYHRLVESRGHLRLPISILATIIVGGLLLHSIALDRNYCTWRYDSPPPIVRGFYSYFEQHPTNLTILTSDPVPAAYSDAKFIPAVQDIPTSIKLMEQGLRDNKTGWIIFKQSSYPCLSGDMQCEEQRERLFRLVKKNTLVYNQSFYGEPYLIYSINHSLFHE